MNPSCDQVQEAVFRWEELSTMERMEVETHLRSCPRCRAFYQGERELRRLFELWHEALEVKVFRWSRAAAVAVGAAAVLALLLSLGVPFKRSSEPFYGWGIVETWAVVSAEAPVVVTVCEAPQGFWEEGKGMGQPVRWIQILPMWSEVRVQEGRKEVRS